MLHAKLLGGKTFLREATFGFEDGIVTAIGVITGIFGAAASSYVLFLAWSIEAFAGGISMAAGTYLSIKSQKDIHFSDNRKHSKDGSDHEELLNPIKAAFFMCIAFIMGSIFPILPYFMFPPSSLTLALSIMFAMAALFSFGSYKVRYTKRNWIKSGIEMMVIGMIAALAGYLIGLAFRV